jgi:alpha-L-rhamnosidase
MHKQSLRVLSVFIFALLCCCAVSGAAGVTPVDLRCEYLSNPLGIDELSPRLSWRLESKARRQKQIAYQILAASSADQCQAGKADLWDSGKVSSSHSTQIAYAGKKLESGMRCFWKVMVWDKDGRRSASSSVASWSMGLLDASDWHAEWIGYDKVVKPKTKPAKKAPELVIIKAFYGVPGDPIKQVDLKEKLQKQVDAGQLKVKGANDFAGSDPAHGVVKKFELEYTLDGKAIKSVTAENVEVDLLTGKKSVKAVKEKHYLPAPYLRKEFKIADQVKRAVIYATAQGFYELSVNGKRVSDDFFMPGWTDYRKRIYYRTYDVTDMLNKGNNAIGAILADGWFRGNISVVGQNQYGKLLRLKTQLQIDYTDGQSEIIASDQSWKASFGPIIESDMQAGETYDARKEMPGWDISGFDDSSWSQVDVGSDTKAVLEAYPGVPVRRTQEMPTVKLTEPKSGKFVFDMGQNFSGWVRLKVKGSAGDTVVMRFAEMLNADGTVYTENLRSARATDTYILKGGPEKIWEPRFTFHGFRYVELTGLPKNRHRKWSQVS